MKTPAPKHTYLVAYKRTPDGMVFTDTINNVTAQKIVEILTDIESDPYQTEILSIVKIS